MRNYMNYITQHKYLYVTPLMPSYQILYLHTNIRGWEETITMIVELLLQAGVSGKAFFEVKTVSISTWQHVLNAKDACGIIINMWANPNINYNRKGGIRPPLLWSTIAPIPLNSKISPFWVFTFLCEKVFTFLHFLTSLATSCFIPTRS